MKRRVLILLSVIITTLCVYGCTSKDNNQAGTASYEDESSLFVADENKATVEASSKADETETTTVEDINESASMEETTEAIVVTTEAATQVTVETTTEIQTQPATQKQTENQTQPVTQAPETMVVEETTTERATYDICSEQYAEEVKKYALQYINEIRVEEGNVALTNSSFVELYSQGRSTQLVTNFAHDTSDERAMATQLQYGKYINPVEYGIEGEPYYAPTGQEAICKMSISKYVSPEAMGRKIANGLHKSSGHWNYVGGTLDGYKDYIYSGIGATCDGDYMYVCVTVDTISWE